MAFARVACRAQVGLTAPLVHVEVSLASGLPTFSIVGLPAMVVREAKERVRAALLNSQFEFPAGRITVNLAPADLPKEGGRFDLPIALGVLLASGQLAGAPSARTAPREFYGELGLTGELKAVRGLLPAAAQARCAGHELIVPRANAAEVCAVAPHLVRAADHLLEVCAHVAGTRPLAAGDAPGGARTRPPRTRRAPLDLADVRGQLHAKRALIIAAAGGHSLLMIGPPGCGKSMLAQRLPGLLPPLSGAEALEVAAIASVSAAGFRHESLTERPFRAPHHSQQRARAGRWGSAGAARGGESRPSRRAVPRRAAGVRATRSRGPARAARERVGLGGALRAHYAVPGAQFQLVAAMNPCPCGARGDPAGSCRCTPESVRRYRARVSGPLLDRLDLQIELPRLEAGEFDAPPGEGAGSAAAAAAVDRARELQRTRQGMCNARLADAGVHRWCAPDEPGRRILAAAMQGLRLSGRARQRVLKVARTIADLDGRSVIGVREVSEAVMLRCLDRAGLCGTMGPGAR